jgi:multiple sugar transport system permease protein
MVRALRGGLYVVLSLGLIVTLLPFLWVTLGSFKPTAEMRADLGAVWPKNPTFENFITLFTQLDFLTFFSNSIVVTVVAVLANILFSSLLAYALVMIDFAGKRALFALVLGTLMVPIIATLIPQFVIVANLGLVNTLPGIFLPYLVTPVAVFIMRQYMGSIPEELVEAARIDGASEFRIYARIIMPLCGPGIATVTIFTFLAVWNNFLWPLIVAQTQSAYTLPVALAAFSQSSNSTDFGVLLAGALVIMLPVLILFLALQRRFIQGAAATGMR